MNITVYSTDGCFYCAQLKELFKRAELEYDLVKVGKREIASNDITREDFQELFPRVSGMPYVIIDGVEIGGLVETAKFLVKKGVVSSGK
tara:strand:- start:565 stop:831 length:267 start_codon:yes stop_codon:yes gene_type:complete